MAETTTGKRKYSPRYDGSTDMTAIAEEPETVALRRKSNVDLTLQRDVLEKSKAKSNDKGVGAVFGMNVNADAVDTLKSRFRAAARELGVGVSFDAVPFGDKRVRAEWNLVAGHSRLLVQTRPKRDVKPPQQNGSAAAGKRGRK